MPPFATRWTDESSAFLTAAALALLAIGAFVGITAIVSKLVSRKRPLKPHYVRLSRQAPQSPCPCGRPAAYRDCCRPRDVDALQDSVRSFLIQRWSHRSFAGRRHSRPLRDRLETYPLPRIVLPDWVNRPERHSFPIDESAVRSWSPWTANLESLSDLDGASDQSPI